MTLRLVLLVAIWCVVGVADGPRKITQAEAMSAAVSKVQPEYPVLARQLKITGTVELEVVIAESGAVDTVTPVSGNPVLTKPSAESLKKWKFKPFVQDGAPVKAQVVIKFNFSN
jgi:periplasmic protein TonB